MKSLLFALVISSSLFAEGIAEHSVVFAFLNLPRYLKLCIDSAECRVSKTDRQLLNTMLLNLPAEGDVDWAIRFRSETATPGFFLVDGLVRIAKTGYEVGSPIYINTDQIQGLTLSSAVTVIVHELGHHLGIADHVALELLGARVENNLLSHSETLVGQAGQVVTAIDPASQNDFSQLIVAGPENIVDLTSSLRNLVRCPSDYDVTRGAKLANLHWDGAQLQSRMTLYCGKAGAFAAPLAGESDLRVGLSPYSVVQVHCADGKCH